MVEVQKYDFNLIADDYNAHHFAHHNFIEIIKNNYSINSDSNIIDIGCGTGNETINLFDSFKCNVIGVEPSEGMLSIAKNNNSYVQWFQGSAENIPVLDKSTDIITAFFSIHHFYNIEKSFNEFNRVLKKNGKIFIFSISHKQMKNSLEYKFLPDLLDADISRVPEIKEIEKAFLKLNYTTISIELNYEKRLIDENYVEMVKNRYRSGLRLLNDSQIEEGVLRINKLILKNKKITDNVKCSVVIAERC